MLAYLHSRENISGKVFEVHFKACLHVVKRLFDGCQTFVWQLSGDRLTTYNYPINMYSLGFGISFYEILNYVWCNIPIIIDPVSILNLTPQPNRLPHEVQNMTATGWQQLPLRGGNNLHNVVLTIATTRGSKNGVATGIKKRDVSNWWWEGSFYTSGKGFTCGRKRDGFV